MRLNFFIILALIGIAPLAAAQAPSQMMPHFPGMETGTIEGRIYAQDAKGKKSPLPEQTIAIMVFKDGQRILMLDKEADAKGNFVVQNVFKDPSFVYALGTLYQDRLYVIPNLQLKKEDKKKVLDFPVGAGSPYLVENMDHPPQGAQPAKEGGAAVDLGMPTQAASQKAEFSVASAFAHSHQKTALVLSLVVLLMGFYFALKGNSPHSK